MKKMSNEMTRKCFAGWEKCRICNNYVSGGVLKKYAHCVKHSTKFVFSVIDLYSMYRKCFKK